MHSDCAIAINGRFLTQQLTGTQRYAAELLSAWGEQSSTRCRAQIIVPNGTLLPPQSDLAGKFSIQSAGSLRGHPWEQTQLRQAAGDAFLVNLCNTAPFNRPNQLAVIHDAAVWRQPRAYTWKFRWLYKTLLPRIAHQSKTLATVSKFSVGELREVFGLNSRKIEVMPNGGDHILRIKSDPTALAQHGLEPRRYFLSVGSANLSKNLAFLRCLEPLLVANRLQLVVAGRQAPDVFGRSDQPQTASIRQIGYVDDAQLRALYEGALALVFPSLYEGFGVPLVEAMTCGCPVLASKAASIPEVCGEAAAYFDPTESSSLIEAARGFIHSPSQQDDLREAGRSRAKLYTWRRSAAVLDDLMDGL